MRNVTPQKHEENEILNAARRCFARRGSAARLSPISAKKPAFAPAISTTTLPKDSIVEAMVEAGLAHATTDFARLEESADPLAPLKSELKRFVKRAAGRERASAIEILAEAARNPAMERIVRRHTERMKELLAGSLRRAQKKGP
jgi:hypothetical protein